MESAYISSPSTVRASILNPSILKCRKNLLSNEWISTTSIRNGLQSNSICCVRHHKGTQKRNHWNKTNFASLWGEPVKETTKAYQMNLKERKAAGYQVLTSKAKHPESDIDASSIYVSPQKYQNIENNVYSDVGKVISLIKEDREKHPIPKWLENHIPAAHKGNHMLRFEDIGMLAASTWGRHPLFIPPGLSDLIRWSTTFSPGLKSYGYVFFCSHEIAQRFLDEFNGLTIPGTGLSYKLSWAPFDFHFFYNYGVEEEGEVSENIVLNNPVDAFGEFSLNKKSEMKEEYYKLEDAFEKFYICLDEIFHKEGRARWYYKSSPWPSYYRSQDDGCSTTLYLFMVDPIITEDMLERIFSKYGACYVTCPIGKGWGYVVFEKREDAEDAKRHLEDVFERNEICILTWAIQYDTKVRYDCNRNLGHLPRPYPCDILGSRCTYKQKSP